MSRIPLQSKNDSEYFEVTSQADSLSDSSVNHALIAVAQEVAELLKQVYPLQSDGSEHTGTITVRAIKPGVED